MQFCGFVQGVDEVEINVEVAWVETLSSSLIAVNIAKKDKGTQWE